MTETTTPRKRIDVAKPCCGRMRGHAPTCPEGQKANTPAGQAFLDTKKECAATATGNPVDCGGCEEHAAPAPKVDLATRAVMRAMTPVPPSGFGALFDAFIDDLATRIAAKLSGPVMSPTVRVTVAPDVGCGTITLPAEEGTEVAAGDVVVLNADGKLEPAQTAPADPPAAVVAAAAREVEARKVEEPKKEEKPATPKVDAAAVAEPDEKAIEARVKAGAKAADLIREFRISLKRATAYIEAFKPAATQPTVVEAGGADANASSSAKDVTPAPPKFEALREAAVEYAQKTSKEKLVELLKKYGAAGPDGAVKLSLIPEDKRAAFMAELKTNA